MIFLDVAQALDRVWHTGLLYKIKLLLPLFTNSFIPRKPYKVHYGNSFSSLFRIQAGVSQGNNLSPDFFNIFTSDIPQTQNTFLATYDDNTCILFSNSNSTVAFETL